mmetsp:Transcript_13188/g.27994  ORF Transcript_13188/g.27994 Transcript_13188/m.27994 type:complete len:85 (+) Transcript_13188:226-480(+)
MEEAVPQYPEAKDDNDVDGDGMVKASCCNEGISDDENHMSGFAPTTLGDGSTFCGVQHDSTMLLSWRLELEAEEAKEDKEFSLR